MILPSKRAPIAIKQKLKKLKLDELVRDVLAHVEHTTNWVSQFTTVTKKNGDLRICIDPQPLNVSIVERTLSTPQYT